MNPIKKRRLELELSQYEVERLSGISQAKLSLIERGYRRPKPEELQRLSTILKIQPQEMIEGG